MPAEIVGSNPTGAWMFVSCQCCVLSGKRLCDELITRPEESCRLWCVVVCDLETSRMRRPLPAGGCCAKKKSFRYRLTLVGFLTASQNVRGETTCVWLCITRTISLFIYILLSASLPITASYSALHLPEGQSGVHFIRTISLV